MTHASDLWKLHLQRPKSIFTFLFCAVTCIPTTGNAMGPTLSKANAFMKKAETTLLDLNTKFQTADWLKSTDITDEHETGAAKANEALIQETLNLVKESQQYGRLKLPPGIARKIKILKNSLTVATPLDSKLSQELTQILASLEGQYGKGEYCPPGKAKCLDLEELSNTLAKSQDPAELLDAWKGWHSISKPMKKEFTRYVNLGNQGARDLGFADTGAMWRAKYDMAPEAFASEIDRLWAQVKPLYISLHAYARNKLREKYGDIVPAKGPIPAHLLGNMWGQSWEYIYPLLAPKDADPGFDLTEILKNKKTTPIEMVRYGESFFTSLGFAPLPNTFWERSLFTKPTDRKVVCHASAWDLDYADDIRIKMCIQVNEEDFTTIHHELGHNFYQRAYKNQPFLFRDSANDGFHEAIGDTIALSVTPEYLVKLGFLNQVPDVSKDIGLLLQRALEKIAFLPFGFLVDQWRWKVFSGEIPPEKYNETWWQLKQKYQGIAAPVARTEEDFDPGAKYHVAANVPYMRYFIADILQFQFHRSLSQISNCKVDLHRCSIYGNKEAGKKLNEMLEMGMSKPWQEALESLTGDRKMDATAILDYFAPLQKWLDEQNRGKPVGWE